MRTDQQAPFSDEFAQILASQNELYNTIAKNDTEKERKVDEKVRTTTDQIYSTELNKGMHDEDILSGDAYKPINRIATENEISKKLNSILLNQDEPEGPGKPYAELMARITNWSRPQEMSIDSPLEESRVHKGLAGFYKALANKQKERNAITDLSHLRQIPDAFSGLKEGGSHGQKQKSPKQRQNEEDDLEDDESPGPKKSFPAVSTFAVPKKKKESQVVAVNDLIQGLYGMARIIEYVPGVEDKIIKERLVHKEIKELLLEEFAPMSDQKFMESMQEIDFEDHLAISEPVMTHNALSSLPTKSDMFYYYHLSPFARSSIGNAGKENEEEIITEFCGYIPKALRGEEKTISKDAYLFAIAGLMPLKKFFLSRSQKKLKSDEQEKPDYLDNEEIKEFAKGEEEEEDDIEQLRRSSETPNEDQEESNRYNRKEEESSNSRMKQASIKKEFDENEEDNNDEEEKSAGTATQETKKEASEETKKVEEQKNTEITSNTNDDAEKPKSDAAKQENETASEKPPVEQAAQKADTALSIPGPQHKMSAISASELKPKEEHEVAPVQTVNPVPNPPPNPATFSFSQLSDSTPPAPILQPKSMADQIAERKMTENPQPTAALLPVTQKPLNTTPHSITSLSGPSLPVQEKPSASLSPSLTNPRLLQKHQTIEQAIQSTEELISIYKQNTQDVSFKAVIAKRIYLSVEEIIEMLSFYDKSKLIDEKLLVRLAEIGKKYLEGSMQSKLLRIVLDEHRKAQESKIAGYEKEHEKMASPEDAFSDKYKILGSLLKKYPEEVLKGLEDKLLKKMLENEMARKSSSEFQRSPANDSRHDKRGKQPKETPRQKKAQKTGIQYSQTMIGSEKKAKKQNSLTAGKSPFKTGIAPAKLVQSPATTSGKMNPTKSVIRLHNLASKGNMLHSKSTIVAEKMDDWLGPKNDELESEDNWERNLEEK